MSKIAMLCPRPTQKKKTKKQRWMEKSRRLKKSNSANDNVNARSTLRRKCCGVCCVVRLVECWRFFPFSRSIACSPCGHPFCSVLSACVLPHTLSWALRAFLSAGTNTGRSRDVTPPRARAQRCLILMRHAPSWQARSSGVSSTD